MESNKDPRNKPSHTWLSHLQKWCQDHSMRKGQSLQKLELGKLDIHMQKNQVGPLPYATFKN